MTTNNSGKEILMRRLILIVAVIAAFGLGFLLRGGGDRPAAPASGTGEHAPAADKPTTWTCSMHPQIKLPNPGKCPICFMDLIPLESGAEEELGPRTLQMSEAAAALADIRTSVVTRRSAATQLKLIGDIDYDETLERTISSWIPGRIDTLFVDYTGDVVRKGEPLVSIYSPELYAAQTELLSSITAAGSLQGSPDPLLADTARQTVTSARQRLKLWGLDESQIAAIERRGFAVDHIRIPAPLSGVVIHKNALEGRYVKTGEPLYTVADLSRVWLTIRAYEADLPWLREGQTVKFSVAALPGRTFGGAIIFIDPVLDLRTRTAEVRVEVPNPDGVLKPGLYADAVVEATLGHQGEPASDADREPLVIPATAPLITGKRAIVYVRDPDAEKPTFSGREVVLGPRAGDVYIVREGLSEGELVVTNGAFKIDSALQIQAQPSMMNPTGGGPAPGHHHGGDAPSAAPATAAAGHEDETVVHDAPAAFTKQLGAVLDAYLDVQGALAGDDDTAAAGSARDLTEALGQVDMALLSGDAHMAWMKDLAALEKGATALAGADDIEARRQAFLGIGPVLWSALERFGYQDGRTIRRFNCPMADDNAGGDWIQLDATTANPYFGAAMLRCGSQTDSLTAQHRGDHSD